ncbi:MAG: UvrD-helicase domain-containing protein [Patescibacteria group bacterium]|nr:UvrD-helicase domain-containing protein [Patescibacteria group bacterium]
MKDILKNLNPKQKEAVQATDGPVLVIAGPGSGKTKVLTHRIAYLIKSKGINPNNILAVTFTNKAAQEMKERIKKLLRETENEEYLGDNFEGLVDENNIPLSKSSNIQLPIVGTFHSICVRILRMETPFIKYKKDFVIYDSADQISTVKKVMKELQINPEQFKPTSVLSQISNAKNELKTARDYSEIAEDYFQENISKIYDGYQKKLLESNAMDFDDLIMQTTILFAKNPAVLKKYQDRYKYVLVDEYQDTNHAQYNLVNLLSKAHRNLCVVGDDWQSIYKWRGADIKNILEFEKNYPETMVVLLEQNYRSTQTILNASSYLIAKNVKKKEKKLWTDEIAGYPIVAYEAKDEKGEAEFVVSEIARLNKQNGEEKSVPLGDIAILYRTNAQSRSIEEAFLQYGVPYKIIGGVKFYARQEIKDITAYLRLIQNPNDPVSFERIVNVPLRKIGKTTTEKVLAESRKERKDITETILSYDNNNLTSDKIKKLKEFAKLIKDGQKKCSETKTLEFLGYLIKEIGFEKYIKDGTEEGERRWENVLELFTAVEKYKNIPARDGVRIFLEEITLAADIDGLDNSHNSVTLMTLHSSKGLEFNTVFIIGLEEGLLPHSRSLSDLAEMEEERRLCYVGITRAKKRVYLLFAKTRKIYGSIQANYPSRFISDIPENLLESKVQDYGSEDEYIELD